jgi:hypothetical protein
MRSVPDHEGTRPWFEADDWEQRANVAGLTQRERSLVSCFRRDGYLVVEDPRIIDDLDVDGIWTRLAAAFDVHGNGRVQDAWTTDFAVRAIARHPAVLDTLRLLYGREPLPFQTLNFLNGTEQRTHSDTIHFSSLPSGFMCGVWMALEDVTLRQGPLHYYPGSQRLPELDYEDLGLPPVLGDQTWENPNTRATYHRYEEKIADVARGSGFRREELALARGSFLVWSANLLHGGSPRDDRTLTRRSQVTHYYFDNSLPYTPMFSRRSEGRYAIRRLRNIVTGRWIVPSLDGAPVVFPEPHEGLRRIRRVPGLGGALVAQTMAIHGGLPSSVPNALRLMAHRIAERFR